eukprot:TRINITY_DN4350_c0_g1_i2.p1 TRINITY_DN4350_c0_g1~~TRINITY_DN4350_c0_g1_i2.p1  ORF type:complete len:678 (+),score=195.42 TRINITY_DN4350_c0_g1_i2:52-2085(+)
MGKSTTDTIKIYLRVRPATNPSKNYSIAKEFDHAMVKFHLDKNVHREVINNSVEDYSFKFTDVFDKETQQDQIFDRVAKGCVESVLDGYNSTIFAYGQTGSGKTFSITGGSESYDQRGIIPRAIGMIFDELNKKTDIDYTVRVSYMQIYNDKGQDLLNKGRDAKSLDELPKVSIQEADDEFVVKELGQHRCDRQEDALNLLFLGDTNRMYCETSMNATSSRSHCIFTLSIEQRTPGTAVVKRSKLHLVDLAGSERVKKTGAEGKLLQEARFINLSLHYLQEVITALCDKAEGRRDHIPYRQSLMTMVLRDSLGGNCRTVMLATAHPQDAFMDETISTCKFAQRVASIKTEARINEETDPTLLVKKLKIEVAALKDELAMYRNGEQAGDRILGVDEKEKCKDIVYRYIADSDEDAKLVGLEGDMARFYYCFAFLKELVKGGSGRSAKQGAAVPSPTGITSGTSSTGASVDPDALQQLQLQLQAKDNELSMLLSIVQKYQVQKHTMGTQTGATQGQEPQSKYTHSTPPSSPPLSRAMPSDASKHDQVKMIALQHKLGADYNLDALDMQGVELLKDTTKAFEEFRKSWRKFEQIEKQKDEQRRRCDRARALAATVCDRCTRTHVHRLTSSLHGYLRSRARYSSSGRSVPRKGGTSPIRKRRSYLPSWTQARCSTVSWSLN